MGSQDRWLVSNGGFITVGHSFERLVIWPRRMDRHDRRHGVSAYFPVAISTSSGSHIGCTCCDSRSDWRNNLILALLQAFLFSDVYLRFGFVQRG